MFDNIGEKLKNFAKAIWGIGIVLSIVAAIAMLTIMETEGGFILALAVLLGGLLFFWITSLLLYAFGEIVVKLTAIEQNTSH